MLVCRSGFGLSGSKRRFQERQPVARLEPSKASIATPAQPHRRRAPIFHVAADASDRAMTFSMMFVQAKLAAQNPRVTPPRVVSGPTLLTGLAVCEKCGSGMTRTGNFLLFLRRAPSAGRHDLQGLSYPHGGSGRSGRKQFKGTVALANKLAHIVCTVTRLACRFDARLGAV